MPRLPSPPNLGKMKSDAWAGWGEAQAQGKQRTQEIYDNQNTAAQMQLEQSKFQHQVRQTKWKVTENALDDVLKTLDSTAASRGLDDPTYISLYTSVRADPRLSELARNVGKNWPMLLKSREPITEDPSLRTARETIIKTKADILASQDPSTTQRAIQDAYEAKRTTDLEASLGPQSYYDRRTNTFSDIDPRTGKKSTGAAVRSLMAEYPEDILPANAADKKGVNAYLASTTSYVSEWNKYKNTSTKDKSFRRLGSSGLPGTKTLSKQASDELKSFNRQKGRTTESKNKGPSAPDSIEELYLNLFDSEILQDGKVINPRKMQRDGYRDLQTIYTKLTTMGKRGLASVVKFDDSYVKKDKETDEEHFQRALTLLIEDYDMYMLESDGSPIELKNSDGSIRYLDISFGQPAIYWYKSYDDIEKLEKLIKTGSLSSVEISDIKSENRRIGNLAKKSPDISRSPESFRRAQNRIA